VKHASEPKFVQAFENDPTGTTPLTETLQKVAQNLDKERDSLVFILTDGEPNGGKDGFIRAIKQVVNTGAGAKVRVQIMACTAEDDEIAWLSGLDREVAEVDVTDDFYTEKQEVLKAGLTTRFTRGDWCMKAMLGPVTKKFDKWDETLHPRSVNSAECNLCNVQ